MAIDFTTNPGGLFPRIGRILKIPFLLTPYESSLVTAFNNVVAQYLAAQPTVGQSVGIQADGMIRAASAVMGFASGAQGTINAAWDTIVQMVYADQPNQSWTRKAAMAEVIRQMNVGGVTVLTNVISCTPTQVTGSIGSGPIVVTTQRGDGLVQENTIAETLRVVCTDDSYTGNATQGREQFSLVGAPALAGVWDYDYPTGSGAGVQINAISTTVDATSGNNLTTNGDFQSWTGATPALDNWTLETGAWGTDAAQNVTTPFASRAFDLQINAGATNTALYQEFDNSAGSDIELPALASFAVSLPMMRTGAVSAGVLTVELVDSTGTAIDDDQGTPNSFTIDLTALTTSYVHQTGVFRLPSNPPAVIRLRLRISTDLAGANVRIGECAFAALTAMYIGGPGFAIFAGATPFVLGDGWSIANTNDQGGASNLATFQTGFQRLFDMRSMGLLLPSDDPATVANTLITA